MSAEYAKDRAFPDPTPIPGPSRNHGIRFFLSHLDQGHSRPAEPNSPGIPLFENPCRTRFFGFFPCYEESGMKGTVCLLLLLGSRCRRSGIVVLGEREELLVNPLSLVKVSMKIDLGGLD